MRSLRLPVLKVAGSIVRITFGGKIVNPRNEVLSTQIQLNPSNSFESLSQRVQKWLFVILLNCLLWPLAQSVCDK